MTSAREDREFGEKMLEQFDFSSLLGEAVPWIGENLSPEDVFDESRLSDWATDNGFVEKE